MNQMEDKFSRQIGALGTNVMKKISNLNILVIGTDTIGNEMSKSLALMGVKKIFLYDPRCYSHVHYGRLVHFGGTAGFNDKYGPLGSKPLSSLCKIFIDMLDTGIIVEKVNHLSDVYELIEENRINGVVVTDIHGKFNVLDIERLCIVNQTPFILGVNIELTGYIFVNFGKWKIEDKMDEVKLSGYILDYDSSSDDIITIKVDCSSKPISLLFSLASGSQKHILEAQSYKTLQKGEDDKKYLYVSFERKDTILSIFEEPNIIFNELPIRETIQHNSFNTVIKDQNYKYINLHTSFSQNNDLHTAMTDYILNPKSKYPFNHVSSKHSKFYVIGALIGGILAQEVIKITGKYEPLNQELLIDYNDLRGKDLYRTQNTLIDIKSLLSKDTIKKMKKTRAFMVGCGALGCEISKNLGMMGFSTTKKAGLRITDMDTIELSNLSRQFMFQNNDIQKLKSDVVKKKLNIYTPEMKVESYSLKVGKETDNVFNRSFWEENDIIINALDNIEARKYVDNKCFIHEKPLFESGTLGTKGNVQAIIPFRTATYSEIKDPPSDSIPMCTIRNFPNNIDHCIEWCLGIFDKVFDQGISDLNMMATDKEGLIGLLDKIENETIKNERLNILFYLYTFYSSLGLFIDENHIEILASNIISLGCFVYKKYYIDVIKEILDTHPDEDGSTFWSGNKLKPKLLNYSKILDSTYFISILQVLDSDNTVDITAYINPPILNEVVLTDKADIMYDNILKHATSEDYCEIEEIIYDKDSNTHNQLLHSWVNTRAICYNIFPTDTLTIKLKSGKIIPALSTTTSIISALVVLDIIKYLNNTNKYTEININVANNIYNVYQAQRPTPTYNNMFHPDYGFKVKAIPKDFDTWARISVNRKNVKTLFELMIFLKKKYDIRPNLITCGECIVYDSDINRNLNMVEIYDLTSKSKKIPFDLKNKLVLDLICFNEGGLPILTPPIIYSYQ